MRYPNVYQALKRLLRAEILYLFSIPVCLYFGLVGSWGPISGTIAADVLSWLLRGLCITVAILRITALGQAALDEDTFRSAQRMAVLYLLFCVLDTAVMPFITDTLSMLLETGELQEQVALYCSLYLALCMIEIASSFSAVLSFIGSLERIAVREKKTDEQEQISRFKLLYGRLVLCAFLAFGLKLLLPDGMTPGNLFSSLFGMAILMTLFTAWWLFLCSLRPASDMLLRTEWKQENQWNGVARELRPQLLNLYDPDAADQPPEKEPRLSWKPEAPWKGAAQELLPESIQRKERREAARAAEVWNGYTPKPKASHSIWEYDVERFFKERNVTLTKEDEETKDLKFPNVYCAMKNLIRAEWISLSSLLVSFVVFLAAVLGLVGSSYGSQLERVVYLILPASVLGRVAALLLWRALLRAPLDEIAFLPCKKLLTRSFYAVLILFITPFYLSAFTRTPDFSIITVFLHVIWVVWGGIPFLVTLSLQKAFAQLAEKLGEWDRAEQWRRLHRRSLTLCALVPIVLAFVVLLDVLLPDAQTFNSFVCLVLIAPLLLGLAALWYALVNDLTRAKQTLAEAKVIQSSADQGAGIDYARDRKPEPEAPKPYE